jgi:uncharacterized protein YwgA
LTKTSDISLLIAVFGFHNEKKIEGRTRIQKEICLLKFKAKIPFTFNYKSYYYGPYSEELSETINTLVGVKLLKETAFSVGYNSYRYDYSLTEQGEILFKKICQNLDPIINKLQEEANSIEEIETPRLVLLAKAVSGMDSICQ